MLKQHFGCRVSKTDEKHPDNNKGAPQRKPLKKHEIQLSVIIEDLPGHREQLMTFDLGKIRSFHIAGSNDGDACHL